MQNRLQSDLDNILARTEPLWQNLRGGRILITGATGFFGCWLLESFAWANRQLGLGAQAVALARHPEVLFQKAPHLTSDPAIALHAADVRCGDFPKGEFSHVIHAATAASAQLNHDSPRLMFDTIVEGTRRTLSSAISPCTSRFLFVSSGAVYGSQSLHVTHVDESPGGGPDSLDRNSAYAEGKRAAEMLCALSATPRLSVTIARCFAFVGPYMQLDAHFAIGNFVLDALRHKTIFVKGDGSSVRSYLYASDLAVWLWTLLFRGKSGQAYNVGSEEALNIAAVANAVAAAVPPRVSVSFASASRPNAPAHRYVPSTARARAELGLKAETSLHEAIRRTYDWFATQPSQQPFERATGAYA